MNVFRIVLTVTGLILTAMYLLLWAESSFRVSRVVYNDDGIEIPGLLVQRPFGHPVFFPFEVACGFGWRLIFKEDEARIRPMTEVNAVGGKNTRTLYLPGAVMLEHESEESQAEENRLTQKQKT